MFDQPRLDGAGDVTGCMGGYPPEGGPGVSVGRRKRVFRRESVVDGDGGDSGLGGEDSEEAVVEKGEGRAEAEGAAVEVKEDWKLLAGVGQRWEVDPGGDVRQDGEVLGGDSDGSITERFRRGEGGGLEPLDSAVGVDY